MFSIQTILPETTISNSVKIATHDTGLLWPYSVLSGRGVKLFCVFVWLTPIDCDWCVGVVGGFSDDDDDTDADDDNDVVDAVLMLPLLNDHIMHVQSFDPVTTYEPQLSSAIHVMMSKCFVIDATGLPRLTLNTFNELSQQPAV